MPTLANAAIPNLARLSACSHSGGICPHHPPLNGATLTTPPRLTIFQKVPEILKAHPLPVHWESPKMNSVHEKLLAVIFSAFSLTSLGHPDLEHMWAAIKLAETGDAELWTIGVVQMCDRMGNILLVAGLLLATSAVFITTSPPRAALVNYTLRGPYICILNSFGFLLGGIIVAAVCYLLISKANPDYVQEVMFRNRRQVWFTLVMMSYPFFSIGLATLFLAIGILAAAWAAEDGGAHGGAPILLALPLGIGALFCYSCATAKYDPDYACPMP
ncbi:hypothetical protein MKEN_01452100 [Mycena kentingensis (nom. inval.)]|nr:hypothetical protein MKEN_01452100 [Mycena kentingensis (nom. inval.)]